MNISEAGIKLIKSFEGCMLMAYPDPGTGGDPWTAGWGHTGSDVQRGLQITQEQADEWLLKDLEKAERCVNNAVKGQITQGMFDALCSFVHNLGCGALNQSTLLRLLNSGDDDKAANEFVRWNRAGGHVMAGLTRRRQAEMELFLA